MVFNRMNGEVRKEQLFIAAFSLLFGIIYSLADQLYCFNRVSLAWGKVFIAWLGCYFLLNVIWYVTCNCFQKTEERKHYSFKLEMVLFFILLVSYIICLFTYFPGVGMNDGLNILNERMSISKQFPVFYCAFVTLLGKIGYHFGTLQISIALYSVCQVIAASLISAGIIGWFWRKRVPQIIKIIFALFFVFEPLVSMYVISMLKDTLFSLLLIGAMIFLYEIIHESPWPNKGKLFWVLFWMDLAGIAVLRNNGVYISVVLLIILTYGYSAYRKKFVLMIGGLIVILGLGKLVMLHYGEEQLFQEVAGIPLQQIAAVVSEDGDMTEEQEVFIGQIMSLDIIKEKYNPYTLDVLKWDHENFNREFLNENKGEFLKIWAQLLPKNLDIYIKAYLNQTYWFWAPRQEGTVQCFYTILNFAGNQWLYEFVENNGIHDQPLFPETINNVLRSYYNLGQYYFREGVCFWIMLGSAFLLFLKKRDWNQLLIYLPCILLWLTIMISTPVASSMRYVFAFVYGLPVFVGVLFIGEKNGEQNE